MSDPVKDFEHALLVEKVVTRFASRVAMEFSTQEALKTYLKEHPDADRSKHSVRAPSEGGSDDDAEERKKRITNLKRQIKENPGKSEEDLYNLKEDKAHLKREEEGGGPNSKSEPEKPNPFKGYDFDKPLPVPSGDYKTQVNHLHKKLENVGRHELQSALDKAEKRRKNLDNARSGRKSHGDESTKEELKEIADFEVMISAINKALRDDRPE